VLAAHRISNHDRSASSRHRDVRAGASSLPSSRPLSSEADPPVDPGSNHESGPRHQGRDVRALLAPPALRVHSRIGAEAPPLLYSSGPLTNPAPSTIFVGLLTNPLTTEVPRDRILRYRAAPCIHAPCIPASCIHA